MNSQATRYRAPARVNIIGEHADYNDGFVLPTTAAIFTDVTGTPRHDRVINVETRTLGESASFNLDSIQHSEAKSWVNYIKGVAAELEESGIELRGVDLVIESDIPLGAGLSSSAALEVAVARTLLQVSGTDMAGPDVARLCQRAEHEYAGVMCGIMDQYTIACCESDSAILIDCRSMETKTVAFPSGIGFVITDSGIRHKLSDGAYNDRAEACASAVRIIAETDPEVHALRDVDEEMLQRHQNRLGDELYRRCRHVVSEEIRVLKAVRAIEHGELEQLGSLLDACHASLRDDYEVSSDEIDALVVVANECDGVLGSRLVGAGFGGCVLSLVHAHQAEAAAMEIRERYANAMGFAPWQHIVEPAGHVTEAVAS